MATWNISDARIAVISDVHANLEALEAVLRDIEAEGISTIVNLGDIVTYGPDPVACLDLLMGVTDFHLEGNHENALFGGETFDKLYDKNKKAAEWTRKEIEESGDPEKYFEFMRELSPSADLLGSLEGWKAYHGSPINPLRDYISSSFGTPEMRPHLFTPLKGKALVGHSHVAGVYAANGKKIELWAAALAKGSGFDHLAQDNGGVVPFDDTYFDQVRRLELSLARMGDLKVILNPGAVGQPRDRDHRASYAILTPDSITYKKVPYDREPTMRKIVERIMGGDKDTAEYFASRIRDAI